MCRRLAMAFVIPSAPVSEHAPKPNDEVPSPTETRQYCHVIWDWNGTLLDDVNYSVDLMNALLDRHGLPRIDLARYRAIFDFPIRVYYERAEFDLSGDGTFEHLGREWMDAYEVGRLTCSYFCGMMGPTLVPSSGRAQVLRDHPTKLGVSRVQDG